jgi:hypothetical protein
MEKFLFESTIGQQQQQDDLQVSGNVVVLLVGNRYAVAAARYL